ncbi:hypothetical protein HPG69_010569 [Diceros bicornis minor]|uniref:Uncharacterized protein n=1 Tax=Diceros bicornis minor TaxID=77932 RepID=A0A7J7EK98_DICBM|nr:hypothetical protein HPG69_010569 [Diceros bicornis minor]
MQALRLWICFPASPTLRTLQIPWYSKESGRCQDYAPYRFGNGVIQPGQSFAVSGATGGRGSASEVTTCLVTLWPPASGHRSLRRRAEQSQFGRGPRELLHMDDM